MSHIPNTEQIKAFKQLVSYFKKCKKLGLVIYAKQYCLAAYTKEADDYAEETNKRLLCIGNYGTIPYLFAEVLADSGADDYACYVTEKDQKLFNPNGL